MSLSPVLLLLVQAYCNYLLMFAQWWSFLHRGSPQCNEYLSTWAVLLASKWQSTCNWGFWTRDFHTHYECTSGSEHTTAKWASYNLLAAYYVISLYLSLYVHNEVRHAWTSLVVTSSWLANPYPCHIRTGYSGSVPKSSMYWGFSRSM